MAEKLNPFYQKLDFREPREPKVPIAIVNSEAKFLKSDTMKITKTNEMKEKAMNLARKKLESHRFEDKLLGKSKEKARMKRLDKKNKRGIYG